jgi:hypothetical protein
MLPELRPQEVQVIIKTDKTGPDRLSMTLQYAVNTVSRFEDIVRMIPYGS